MVSGVRLVSVRGPDPRHGTPSGNVARWASCPLVVGKPGDEDAVARGLRRDSAAQKQWFESLRVVSPVVVMRPGLPVMGRGEWGRNGTVPVDEF